MSKRATFVIAGVITALVIVLVFGLAGGATWFNQSASAAGSGASPAVATAPASVR